MTLRITTLSEDTVAHSDLLAEWGLSILVEADDTTILLDAGAGISAAYNTDNLDTDLSKIDKIVLSHGHFDHTGGLRDLLRKMKKEVEIIAHPDVWAPKYSRRKNKPRTGIRGKPDRFMGIPFQRLELERLGARFTLTTEPVHITDSIMTTGEVPMVTDFEKIEPYLYVKAGARWQADKLLDDLALIIKTEPGLVVILGCAHRGVINTLYHAQKLTRMKKIHVVIGGCHLMDASEERIWQTIAAFKELGVEKVSASHCTGMSATMTMANEFGDNFVFNNAGTVIEIP